MTVRMPVQAHSGRKPCVRALGSAVRAAFLGGLLIPFAVPQDAAAQAYGALGAEGTPLRRQEWRVPSPDPATPAHALVLRPRGAGPFPLAIIAHASTQNALARARMELPGYRSLTSYLVARGYAVVLPQRPGHGATGGPYLEDQGGCEDADYARAGAATAEAIRAVLSFMRTQPFIKKDGALIVGHSAGGWGALALAASNPPGVARIAVFAPGRGGRANNEAEKVCAPDSLIATAETFGRGTRVPVTWVAAKNDSYFPITLELRMAEAFRASGGKVDFRVLEVFGDEGHWVAEQANERVLGLALEPKR